jgi:putative ABC transport system substrate-binding protein
VAILYPASEEIARPRIGAFRARLAELGYVEGRDAELAIRYATTLDQDTYLRLGAELLALSPAVIVVGNGAAILAVHHLTPSVPVVGVGVPVDPVAAGLAESFAHPGGNVTGFTTYSTAAIAGKQLALLKEMAPSIVRVNALLAGSGAVTARVIPDAARSLRLTIRTFPIVRGDEIAPIVAAADSKTDALFFGSTPLFVTMRHEIAALVERTRIPALYTDSANVSAGGLMSYATSIQKLYASAADYVAKILGGAKPADLPIQQPALYELVINAKTANALGLTIPPTLLARADEVIE